MRPLLLIPFFLMACAEEKDEPSLSFDGTYSLLGIECKNITTGESSTGYLLNGTLTEQVTISGTNATTVVTTASCVSTYTATIDIDLEGGMLSLNSRNSTTSTTASCSQTYSFTYAGGDFTMTPTSKAVTTTHGGTPSNISAPFGYSLDGSVIIIYTPDYTVVGSPSDVCFGVYQR
jgi:hypothetical protein